MSFNPTFGTPVSGWFRWFAWRPVDTADRGWQWLVPLWRRRVQKKFHLSGPDMSWFQQVVTDPRTETGES